jgi:hypothetical protein
MNIVTGWSKNELAQEIRDRLQYFYMQADGTYKFPNSKEGDLLQMTHKLLTKYD